MRLEYFHLIDRIRELDLAQQSIRTEALVPTTSTIFEGHFPGYPLMPGVLLIETMAQTSGWLIIGLTRFDRMPFLMGVKEAKFRTFVSPGQMLVGSAKIVHEGSGYTVTEASLTADDKPVCHATLSFRVMPFPTPAFKAQMIAQSKTVQFPAGAPLDA